MTLTEKQKKLLDELVRQNNLKRAAEELDISYNAAKQRLYRIRRNWRLARNLIKFWDENVKPIWLKLPFCHNCSNLIWMDESYGKRTVKCKEYKEIIKEDMQFHATNL